MSTSTQFESARVNILLVDDNESNLLALETILAAEDRNLIRAVSGDEALQCLLNTDVAVILLDVRMPGIDGLETAELIRGRKKSRDIPIIFLTAYESGDKEELAKGYSLGAVDYLIKPADPSALKAKVSVFVDLFKKTEQVKQQAALLKEKNIQLENANFQRLGKLVELGQQLTAQREPEQLLQLFCDAACDIVGARCACVTILEGVGQTTRHLVGSGLDVAAAAGGDIVAINPERLSDFSRSQPVRLPSSDSARITRAFPGHAVGRSLLAAPITLSDQTIGWLYLVDKLESDEFSEADERLAMTLTGQLAVSYENARLYAAAQRHASELLLEVSERKQAEKEREVLLASEKAARVEAERAQRLSSQLLVREREVRAEAEAANRLKDEFLATVSHELRTPLNAMLGWATLLREKKLDENRAGHAVETIERNARTLARIVGDILDASRIITGKLGLDLKPVVLKRVIEASADVLRPAADAKRVELNLNLPLDGGSIVMGDADRLQQVVWNLLSNAIKFTSPEGRIDVLLKPIQGHAELRVIDSGQGISPEFLPYVFDRFRQADSSMKRSHGGLGLGLAIVRHLVELHGGTVSADSEGKGFGATFTVKIPLAFLEDTSIDVFTARSVPRYGARDSGIRFEKNKSLAGLRVLIIDDDEDTRDLIKTMIEQYGAESRRAATIAEALVIVEDWKPSILLSDIGLAGEDGYELIRRVRLLSSEKGGDVPAVAVTAYASVEDRRRVLDAGFQSHITKPVDQIELIETLVRLKSADSPITPRGRR